MTARRRLVGLAASAVGVAVAGTAAGVAHQSRVIAHRGRGDAVELGSLRSSPVTVVAGDGVALHVETDEFDPLPDADGGGRRRRRQVESPALTVVFVHGYALNLDCWHFQRAGYRGLVRTVYFDQRSHGRSGASPDRTATIEQLGKDLLRVLDEVVPGGPVVLVGHSMGGMSIIALAEAHPELFGSRVVGVALISTTAGGLKPSRLFLPLLPASIGGEVATRMVAVLARTAKVVDGLRRVTQSVSMVATDIFAFGDHVPASYVAFVDEMLAGTPFEVVAKFFPHLNALDKFEVMEAFERVPTTIVCGTADKMISVGHSRKMAVAVDSATLVECEGAGHLVIMERHEQVNAALDQLIAAAVEHRTEPAPER